MTGLVDYLPEQVNPNCGVYMIRNTRNGKKYIGSTKDVNGRQKAHFYSLQKGKHHCDYLQNAWNAEEDKEVFKFFVFLICKEGELIELEQKCLQHMKPEYNSSSVAGRPEMTLEVRNKISNRLKGRLGPWKGVTGPEHPSFGRKDMSGKANPNYGKTGAMSGITGQDHPRFGKSSWSKGKTGPSHPTYGMKGAWAGVCGQNHPTAKLTQDQADEIRKLSLEKTMTQKDIAQLYGVSVDLVRTIKYNRGYVLKDTNND
jgi:group I intron endonuclease